MSIPLAQMWIVVWCWSNMVLEERVDYGVKSQMLLYYELTLSWLSHTRPWLVPFHCHTVKIHWPHKACWYLSMLSERYLHDEFKYGNIIFIWASTRKVGLGVESVMWLAYQSHCSGPKHDQMQTFLLVWFWSVDVTSSLMGHWPNISKEWKNEAYDWLGMVIHKVMGAS